MVVEVVAPVDAVVDVGLLPVVLVPPPPPATVVEEAAAGVAPLGPRVTHKPAATATTNNVSTSTSSR